jgi:predicted dehydrogenase
MSKIGVIGCETICGAYLNAVRGFPILDICGVADLDFAPAERRAADFAVPATDVPTLLADPSIEIVINLTIPAAHVDLGLAAIAAGKHVYSEKPLAIELPEARRLLDAGR